MDNSTYDMDNESYTENDSFNDTEFCGDVSFDNNTNGSFHHAIVNISNQYPLKLAMPLYGYAMPFLLVITTIANTLIVAVLWQRHMRSPSNAVLLAMAISDLLTVVFPEPMFFYMYTLNNHATPLYPAAACYAWSFLHDLIPNLFHTASIWLTVALAVQRYIYVCHAPVARVWCTLPRVTKAIALIFVLATIHLSPRFLDIGYNEIEILWQGECIPVCEYILRSWVHSILSEPVYFSLFFGFRIIFVHLGPCTVLVVLNVLLYRALREAQKRREKLMQDKDSSKKECKKLCDANCTTLMLIVVVSVVLVTEIPLAIITFLHIISNTGLVPIFSEEDYDMVSCFFIISNSFIIFSYPFNFAIYCGMSKQFRETFRDLFVRRNPMGREDSTKYSVMNGPPRTCTSETVV